MAFWRPSTNKFYIPPQPITRAVSTDEFVHRLNVFYHASTERLLMVGHPYFSIEKQPPPPATSDDFPLKVPKVSPYQYRVFRLKLPNPNEFVFPDKSAYNPDTERLVWACRGLEIGRGGPLGIGLVGHPYLNKFEDVENIPLVDAAVRLNAQVNNQDFRRNTAFDGKQTQMFMVGNHPPVGTYWTLAKKCKEQPEDDDIAPPIELKDKIIEDGQMGDYGFGNLDTKTLAANKSDFPLDMVDEVVVYPDYLKMTRELFGNSLWFYARREQMYARHYFNRYSQQQQDEEAIPTEIAWLGQQAPYDKYSYTAGPSGSLVSTDTQLFNRPYWMSRAQGLNNGICWNNEMFITVLDTTRGTNFNISVSEAATPPENYQGDNYKEFVRHVEEYEISLIFQLCKVKLTAETLAYLHNMDPRIIDLWDLNIQSPPNDDLHEVYRWIQSLATKCPDDALPIVPKDPWSDCNFWNVDLTERFSEQLDQYNLGRRFLFQAGLTNNTIGQQVVTRPIRTLKRKRSTKTTSKKHKK
uniref:Major capsid protein L1 n=1 Tax=Mops bat papillomavirus TaxID=3141892 RepID=A0AAU7E3V6_9PAPI